MPRRFFVLCMVVLTGLAVLSSASFGQEQEDRSKLPSPPASTSCTFADGKTIKVDYSSPRMRGRKIFGGLVPYGEVWRAGANEATTFVINTNVTVGQKDVPAGSYTLFTLPNQSGWKLIVSKQTGEWGIPYPGDQYDFARIDMQISKLPSRLENFTISFNKADNRCNLRMDWETTRVSIDIGEKK